MSTHGFDLARQVEAAIRQDPRVAPRAGAISVEARDGTVTLRGVVERLSEKGAAGAAARSVPGVAGVDNGLLVGPRDRTDAEVERAVLDALIQDPYIDERDVRVSVVDGVVTLAGEVESLTHKRLAGGIAWWMRGVRDVVNELRTRETAPADRASSDDLLAAAVSCLLDKDPLVDEVEVKVIAQSGVVTLVGTVCGQVERDAAEQDAWATLGVLEVRNTLVVVPAPTRAGDYQP